MSVYNIIIGVLATTDICKNIGRPANMIQDLNCTDHILIEINKNTKNTYRELRKLVFTRTVVKVTI